MTRLAAATAIVALAATATPAYADDIVAGTVLKVDHGEIYVNLGRGRGLVDGAPLRLKRGIKLRNPITRAAVSDWIPLGIATVTEAGERMSRAVLDADLVASIRVGDIAEIYVDTPDVIAPPTAPAPAPGPEAPVPVIDPVTTEVLAVFAAQSGAPLDARIAAWEGYQAAHPGSPFAAAITADLDQLRELRDTLAPTATGVRELSPVALDHHPPTVAAADTDVPVVFVIDRPERVAAGWLHYRAAGARTYQRVLLRREHDIYLRGAIPGAAVHGARVEYFVEVTSPRGDGGVALGSPAAPVTIAVERPRLVDQFAGVRGRTELTLSTQYLDFANLDKRPGDRTDREIVAEVDVRYRLHGPIKHIGAGYGVFSGTGGTDARWTPEAPAPRTGFNYGYAEAGVGTSTGFPLAFAARVYAGVGRDGFQLGVEARGRLGAEDGANLTATVRNVKKIGFLSDLRLEAWPRPHLPIGVAVGVLDQPAAGDVAVKLAVDLGYQIGPVAPVVKVSWQGRSIDHGGVGGGLALAFRW